MVFDIKKTFRRQALAYRENLSSMEHAWRVASMLEHLSTLLQSRGPCTVAIYQPIRGEPDLLALLSDKNLIRFTWLTPVCSETPNGKVLKFAKFGPSTTWVAGQYGIPVPADCNWGEPDVVVMPCVGFHRLGYRLGYGAGWYDSTLAALNPKPWSVGVAFSGTEFDVTFHEPHDQALDAVVTEDGVIFPSSPQQNQ